VASVSPPSHLDSEPDEIQRLSEVGYFTEKSYPSPGHRKELRLDEGGEFRMGCDVWFRTRLFEDQKDHSEQHRPLLRHVEDNYPYSTTGLYPWNVAGDKISLPTVSTLGVGFMVYDLGHAQLTFSCTDRLWRGSAWSPSHDEVLIMLGDEGVLVDGSGEILGKVMRNGQTTVPLCGWTPSGESFFCLEQGRGQGVPILRFFSRETLEQLDEIPLDPMDLVPSRENLIAGIDRDTYSLPMTSGAVGMGELLDHWSHSSMIGPNGELLLAVVRPSSEASGRFDESWVSVVISD
jgi:hypothetical protein